MLTSCLALRLCGIVDRGRLSKMGDTIQLMAYIGLSLLFICGATASFWLAKSPRNRGGRIVASGTDDHRCSFVEGPDGKRIPVSPQINFSGPPVRLIDLLEPNPTSWPGYVSYWYSDSEDIEVPKFMQTWFSDPRAQVWTFSSSDNSWASLTGRAGVACVREGVVISLVVMALN